MTRELADHPCFIQGCEAPAHWGLKQGDTYKWTCFEHRGQLTKASPATAPKNDAAPIGDLFGGKR